jgi:hypothetical protein
MITLLDRFYYDSISYFKKYIGNNDCVCLRIKIDTPNRASKDKMIVVEDAR